MSDFLEQVIAERRAYVAEAKARVPERELRAPVHRRVRLPSRDVAATRGRSFVSEHRGEECHHRFASLVVT